MVMFFLAIDLRVMRLQFNAAFDNILSEELTSSFGLSESMFPELVSKLKNVMKDAMDKTSQMDVEDQMKAVADSGTNILVDFFASTNVMPTTVYMLLPAFRSHVAARSVGLLQNLRSSFLSGKRGSAPAAPYLGRTRGLYEYVRSTLGIKMHGLENLSGFAHGLGEDDVTVGQNVSTIYEAIRDGKTQKLIVDMFHGVEHRRIQGQLTAKL
jgi:phenylalanine ammonia-lyase